MKQVFGLLITVFAASSAMALSVDTVICSVDNGQSLHLVRFNDSLVGQLRDNYNVADVQCEKGGWGPLTYQSDIVCAGIWKNKGEAPTTLFMHMERKWPAPIGIVEYASSWGGLNKRRYVPRDVLKKMTCELWLN
ncbi:hypothetical protein [Bdellovibrio sp. HCB288]|uniref:hypothetical protein n=1 Tax=Bdellovibrio sp. HCB288 TaxID=3394355 RepID=UPI0039B5D85E